MKFLILGGTGQLGSSIINDLSCLKHEIVAPSKREFDIRDFHRDIKFPQILNKILPDVVINTVAYNNLNLAELNKSNTFVCNCISVGDIAKMCNDFNVMFVTFSTDYVFDGKKNKPYIETDIPSPIQTYGLSKMSGEYSSLIYNTTIVIRTSVLYGLNKSTNSKVNFIDEIIEKSKLQTSVEISDNKFVSSTNAEDLSKAIIQLIEYPHKKYGIYHLVNEGYCSLYELAKESFKLLNINTELIPVKHDEFDGKIRRPLFSALRNERAKKLGIVLPHWKDALRRYIEVKYKVS